VSRSEDGDELGDNLRYVSPRPPRTPRPPRPPRDPLTPIEG
jgi:hypothetical protein